MTGWEGKPNHQVELFAQQHILVRTEQVQGLPINTEVELETGETEEKRVNMQEIGGHLCGR